MEARRRNMQASDGHTSLFLYARNSIEQFHQARVHYSVLKMMQLDHC